MKCLSVAFSILLLSFAATPISAQSQSGGQQTAPNWPRWELKVSQSAQTKTPVIAAAHAIYARMISPSWVPSHNLAVAVKKDNPKLKMFCDGRSGRAEIVYDYQTATDDDVLRARFENIGCAKGVSIANLEAVLTMRDGRVWAGLVTVQRGRAIPEMPRGNTPGAMILPSGSVLVSIGRSEYQRVLGDGEYRYNAWINYDGTMISNVAYSDGPISPTGEPLISRTLTDYYLGVSTRRKNTYRGPPAYFEGRRGAAQLSLPNGGDLTGGYYLSAGFFLGRRVEYLSGGDGVTGERNVIPLTTFRHPQLGYQIEGEYEYDFSCGKTPSAFSIEFNAPMTADQPISDGDIAPWRCARFEFIGHMNIFTTKPTVLGRPGYYFAPFGSVAIGRGPRLEDMIVATRRSQIVPITSPQHYLTPMGRSGRTNFAYQDRSEGNSSDFLNTTSNGYNLYYGIDQRYDKALAVANAHVLQNVTERRAAQRRRADFFAGLAATAAGAALSYEQQKQQQAANDAAYRASVAGYMARDAAARAAASGGRPRDRGVRDDRVARAAEQDKITREENGGSGQSQASAATDTRETELKAREAKALAEKRLAEQKKQDRKEEIARTYLETPEAVAVCRILTINGKYRCHSSLSLSGVAVNPTQSAGWRTPAEWVAHVGNCGSRGDMYSLSDGSVYWTCGYGVGGIAGDAAVAAGITIERRVFYCRKEESYCKRTALPTE